MAKIVFLSASPNKSGNTMQIMTECEKVAKEEGLESEIISLAGKKIDACIGCRKCKELKKCALNDGLNEIIEKVKGAEGFVVGSPVYFGTARGDMMNALQRIGMVSRNTDNFLSWKVGGPLAVARRGGSTVTLQEMMMFYLINEMIIPGSTYWNIVFGGQPGEALKDTEGIETVKRFTGNVAKLIKKIK